MMNYIRGVCKNKYKKMMVPVKGFPFPMGEEEFGYNVGDSISITLDDNCAWYDDVNTHIYHVLVNYETFPLTRKEVEELVDIHFEYQSYNSCILNGIPCSRLRGHKDGDNARTRQSVTAYCTIHHEVGRGTCSGYTLTEK